MAFYTTTFQSLADTTFYVDKTPVLSTGCSNIYEYVIYAEDLDSIDISFVGKHKNTKYILNGVSTTFTNSVTGIIYDTSLKVQFIVENSNMAGVFDSSTITITNTTSSETYSDTVTREDDSARCGNIPGGVIMYDQLDDTPADKVGSAGKFIRVTSDELFHEYVEVPEQFTPAQVADLLGLIYVDFTSTITLTTPTGERGVSVTPTVNYNITSGYDVITAATITAPVGNVLADVDGGAKSKSGGANVASKTYTLAITYTRNGVAQPVNNKSATYTAFVPQWAGWSSLTDFTTYAGITGASTLQKYLQSSASISKVNNPVNDYIWFISNKSSATVLDGNNFVQSVGNWSSTTSEFISKSLVLTLADGVTTSTVYLYRSYAPKTLTSFTYKIQ